MVEIQAADAPVRVSRLTVTIVSPPGVGKTSLASTLPGAVLVDADQGAHRTLHRAARITVATWADCLAVHEMPAVREAPVVVDTIGRIVDIAVAQVVKDNAKGTVFQGAPSMQGWGVVKSRVIPWLNGFRDRDLVILCHQREEKKKDDLIVRPDVAGGTLQEVLRSSDLIGYLSLVQGKRVLDFDPQEDRLGKNSASLPVLTVPDLSKGKSTFLGDLLAQAKAAMTSQSEESLKAESMVADWSAQIGTLKEEEDFNRTLGLVILMDEGPIKSQVKTLLNNAAKTVGLKYNRESKAFECVA